MEIWELIITGEEVKMKGDKSFNKKKGKNSTFKDIIYGLKILNECGNRLVASRIIATLSFWFFTGFIEDILLLKYLLHHHLEGL